MYIQLQNYFCRLHFTFQLFGMRLFIMKVTVIQIIKYVDIKGMWDDKLNFREIVQNDGKVL
jgi:hypothetical protein